MMTTRVLTESMPNKENLATLQMTSQDQNFFSTVQPPTEFTIATMNAEGIYSNLPYIQSILKINNLDVLAVQEYWLYGFEINK